MKVHALVSALLLTVATAASSVASPVAAQPSWSWPVSPRPDVLRPFDPPDKPWMSGHRGVDLQTAFDGGPVTAPESGTVSFVGFVVDRPVITIDHGNGLRSSFEPVQSELIAGATVVKGQELGTILSGHCSAQPCIHWGVRRGEEYVNPLAFVMDLRPSILLPLDGGPRAGYQTIAEIPVMERPVTSVLISWVPSYE